MLFYNYSDFFPGMIISRIDSKIDFTILYRNTFQFNYRLNMIFSRIRLPHLLQVQVSVLVALTFAHVESHFYPIVGNAYYDPTGSRNRYLPHVPSINDGGGSGVFKRRFYSHDELGQYANGYDVGHRSKIESKTLDGFTQGSYSYVDTNIGGGGGDYVT